MEEKTQEKLTQELHQGVFGVTGSEDKGLIGDVKELVKVVKDQNKRVNTNEKKIAKIWGILIGVGALGGTGLGLVLGG